MIRCGVIFAVALSVACTEKSSNAKLQSTESLLSEVDALNEQCRGGSGDDPKTRIACDSREAQFAEVSARGWCWGPRSAINEDKHWMRCIDDKTTEAQANNKWFGRTESGRCVPFTIDLAKQTLTSRGYDQIKVAKKADGTLDVYAELEGGESAHTTLYPRCDDPAPTAEKRAVQQQLDTEQASEIKSSFPSNVRKSWSYKPFSITSSQLKKEMPDFQVASIFMCKSPTAALAATMDLLRNYDVIGSDKTDGTLTFTSFEGRQEGGKVSVSLVVDEQSTPRIVRYVFINGQAVLSCN